MDLKKLLYNYKGTILLIVFFVFIIYGYLNESFVIEEVYLYLIFSFMWLSNILVYELKDIVPQVIKYNVWGSTLGAYGIIYMISIYDLNPVISFAFGFLSVFMAFGAGKYLALDQLFENDKFIILKKENLKEFYNWITLRDDEVTNDGIKNIIDEFKNR